MPKSSGAGYGLRLTLPGAPIEAAQVHDGTLQVLPGLYHPEQPTPVGDPGDPLTLDAAKAADADPACHLELVEIPAGDRAFLSALHEAFVLKFKGGNPDWDAVNNLKAARPAVTPDPVED